MIGKVAAFGLGDDAGQRTFVFENDFCGLEECYDQRTSFCPAVSVTLPQCPNQLGQYNQADESGIFRGSAIEKGGCFRELPFVVTKHETEQNVRVDRLHLLFP